MKELAGRRDEQMFPHESFADRPSIGVLTSERSAEGRTARPRGGSSSTLGDGQISHGGGGLENDLASVLR